MPLNGSGSYTPPAPEFPAIPNTVIYAADFNAIVNDIAAALGQAIFRDGQVAFTADQSLGGFKLRLVGNAVLDTDAPNLGQMKANYAFYVGPSATDPLTRLDGSALQAGDLYFNTTSNELRAYTGTVWRAGAAGAVSVQQLAGDGVTTVFTLASAPEGENNTQIYVNAAYQSKTTYTVSGTTLTFSTAPDIGDVVEVVSISTLALGGTDASLCNYTPAGTGAVATTVQAKLRDVVSILDFGADPTGAASCLTAVTNAWTYCLANGKDLYFPAGTYAVIGESSFPFGRIDGLPVVSLLDCHNITIYGDGPSTILKTNSVSGADVLQFNGAKNLHVRNLKLTAEISGTDAGSNGISITGGWDNLTFDSVWCENLPSLDKTSYVDGGKALTIQPPSTGSVLCGTLDAKIFAKGCAEGFGYEPDLDIAADQPTCININIVAENCYQAVKLASAESTGALSVGIENGVRVVATAINCQSALNLGRAHGGYYDVTIVTTKSEAARRLNPNAVAWFAANTDVSGLTCTYAKNADIRVTGDLGACTYKAAIGGTTDANSGFGGATQYCSIYLDIAGTASSSDISQQDIGGNSLLQSKLTYTTVTGTPTLTDFLTAAKKNTIEVIGEYGASLLSGNIRFAATQVASTDVNTLDDYEEGTFVPIFSDWSLVDEGATYSSRYGFYTKIGNAVHFTCAFALTGLGSVGAGDPAFILGLPFASRLQTGNIVVLSVRQSSGLNLSAGDIVIAFMGAGEQYITLKKWTGASTAGDTNLTCGEVSATGALWISGTYFV